MHSPSVVSQQIILSIGMAVDANILIFERMNEEIQEGNHSPLQSTQQKIEVDQQLEMVKFQHFLSEFCSLLLESICLKDLDI